MCGIAGLTGIQNLSGIEIASHVQRMCRLLGHRGPDDQGRFCETGIGLGHVRLSILDLEFGRQPMTSEDGSVVLVFNGEIYNYKDLWQELESKGHHFRTDHSDTEVIVKGYLEWGVDVFSRLDGMFAVGIWNRRTKTLLLARDRVGIKPLYYAQLPRGGLVFASEPKAIVEGGLLETSFDAHSLPEYFTHRAVAAPRTLWRGIVKLPAAHVLSYSERGGVSATRYWTPCPSDRSRLRVSDAVELVETELSRAVKSHLAGDVPVGVFLSGGIDSSLIAAFASRHTDLRAFTIGTPGELDETPTAAAVARRFGLELNRYILEPHDFVHALDDWTYFNDDPVADPSALAILLLSRMARQQGMKVMLSGQGSDELFCGYNSYVRYLALNSIQRIPLASQALKLLHRRLDGRTIDYLEQRRPLTFVGTAHVTTASMRRQMFVDVPPLENHPLIRNTQPGLTPLRDALIFDQLVRLPNDILASTDRATMAAGIEARVPFLDRRVIQAANALADDCCLHPFSFQTKRILKLILNKYLPAELVYRKKVGFDLPIGDWLVTYFRAMAADFLEARVVPCVNYSFWSRLYEMHCTGVSDYAAPIWAWFMLERWYRRWVVNTTTGCPRNLSMLVG